MGGGRWRWGWRGRGGEGGGVAPGEGEVEHGEEWRVRGEAVAEGTCRRRDGWDGEGSHFGVLEGGACGESLKDSARGRYAMLNAQRVIANSAGSAAVVTLKS